MNPTLDRIKEWYLSNCDGDWEHSYGIKIDTLDNPGWAVKIDLADTQFQGAQFKMEIDNGDSDWIFINATGIKYEGSGDPSKLDLILETFISEIIDNQFYTRTQEERDWILKNTWCANCEEADLGMLNPKEESNDGKSYISGICANCSSKVRSEQNS